MSNLYIDKYIYDKKIIKKFYRSCENLFNINNLQIYNPIYSLYFHIFNTKYSHKCIDMKRRFYIQELFNILNNSCI